jgi:hypothetical protein
MKLDNHAACDERSVNARSLIDVQTGVDVQTGKEPLCGSLGLQISSLRRLLRCHLRAMFFERARESGGDHFRSRHFDVAALHHEHQLAIPQ